MGRMTRVCTLIGVGAALALLTASPPLLAQIDDEWISGAPPAAPLPPWLVYRVGPPIVAPPVGSPDASADMQRRWQRIKPRFKQLALQDVERFRMPLFDGSSIMILHTETQDRPGGLVWFGEIEGEPGSHVILSVAGKSLSGSIHSPFRPTMLVDGTAAGGYRVRRVDPSEFKPEGPPITMAAAASVPGPGPAACLDCDDAEPNVDLMVVYTPGARDGWSVNDEPIVLTDEAMEADIYHMVAVANRTFIDSDVAVRLNLVHIAEAPFDDQPGDPDLLPIVTTLITDAEVRDWRDTYAADIVVLLIGEGKENGRSQMPPTGASDTTCGYFASVVKRGSAVAQYTFPHEVGHLFGANHNCLDPNMTVSELDGENHGFDMLEPEPCTGPNGDSVTPWCTLMSTRNTLPGAMIAPIYIARIPYWSSPNLDYPPGESCSELMGTLDGACQAYDAEVLNDALQYVVNYRCSSSSCDNVWMKDTWDDTGGEPDDLTADQDMWKSPDIWVRGQQDTALEFAHEHENPQRGGDNWIYAKLRNGSSNPQTGRLEFRYADAATSTAWESGWTVIEAPVPATIEAHGSTIVELRWPSVPSGSTHFCLLARWLSDDPADQIHGEVEDIAVNVRNNNNIVWKNLTIVNMIEIPDEARVRYIVRHIPEDDSELQRLRVVKLRIAPPGGLKGNSFIGDGRVLVRFDATLLQAWELADSSGSGYQVTPEGILLTNSAGASFDLVMPGSAEGHVELVLGRKPHTPRRDYLLDCSLWDGDLGLGGVSFEIRNAVHVR